MSIKQILLFGCIAGFILLRLPSLIEPFWYGDEGIYAVIGHELRSGAILYRDIWDNKPPFLYFIYALANGNLFWAKIYSLIAGVGAVIAFYCLAGLLFKKTSAIVVATVVFSALFALPVLEGNIANAENFMLFPIALAAYFIFTPKQNYKKYYLSGFLLSLAALTKIVAVFDISAFLFILFLQKRLRVKSLTRSVQAYLSDPKAIKIVSGLVILPFLLVGAYVVSGNGQYLLSSIFTNNISYVEFENHFFFPMGLVFFKTALLIIALVLIYIFRKKLTHIEIIILPWMIFALYSIFFSDRPYTHYVLMGLIPFSLLIGSVVEKARLVPLVLAILVPLLIYWHFPIYKKYQLYYRNFFAYAYGDKSYRDYMTFFDRNAVRDYDLAQFVNKIKNNDDSIYFWSDSAQMYLLTNTKPVTKYIVAYHVIMYAEAEKMLINQVQKSEPRFIVITKDDPIPYDVLIDYTLKYTLERTKIYEKSD